MFSDLMPVIHATFQLENLINNTSFLNYIYGEHRSQWDFYKKNIRKTILNDDCEIEEYTFRFPIKSLEFCDNVLIKPLKNGIAVISFTEETTSKYNNEYEKGINIMTCISLERSLTP